jgi:hypothetical protein
MGINAAVTTAPNKNTDRQLNQASSTDTMTPPTIAPSG